MSGVNSINWARIKMIFCISFWEMGFIDPQK
jgi:hypothetical protein